MKEVRGLWTHHAAFRPTLALFDFKVKEWEEKKARRVRKKEKSNKKCRKWPPLGSPALSNRQALGGCIGGILVENRGSIHPSMPHRVSVANPRWRP